MGWFDEQIKQRKIMDDEAMVESFSNIAKAVLGDDVEGVFFDDNEKIKGAIDEVLKYYHVKSIDVPETITGVDEQLEYLMRPYGIMRRSVSLREDWYNNAIGAMLLKRKSDGSIVTAIPKGLSSYYYRDFSTGKTVKINKKNAQDFETTALAFYKPFPLKKMTIKDLMTYAIGTLSVSDFVFVGLCTLAVTLMGLLTPKISYYIFSDVIFSNNLGALNAMLVALVCITISSTMLGSINSLISQRINTKLSIYVESATMMRVLALPATFFGKYGSGELSSRAQYVNALCSVLVSTVLQTGLTSIFSLIYIGQIFQYAPALVAPALIIILLTVTFSIVSTFAQMKITKQTMELESKENSMSYALISGVQKIKLSGSEKRAFARWGELYAKSAKLTYNPPMFLKINGVISTAISLVGTIVLYYEAIQCSLSTAQYFAFNTSYGMVSGAFAALSSIALTVARIKPILEMAKPLLEAEPEVSEGREVLTRISGAVELNNVSFRYNEDMPLVLDDLSLKIKPGQYVAIVGKTGCGKSTLIRLLLGFEKPQKGAIYYDGRDVNKIDLKSLHQKIGVVLQNGKLFQGDIFSNIVISAPWLTINDAWEAAEMAGIADDIRDMPMGMSTMVFEGGGGISGGQKQRLMIARAVAPKPKILILDEATSALDNMTQKHVSESLDALKCTRIVVAHRLSTIRQCDRIIVLDQGKIIEDGTYDELIANKGFFAELVKRQRLDLGNE